MRISNPLTPTLLVLLGAAACAPAEAEPTKPSLPPRPERTVTPLPERLAEADEGPRGPRGYAITGRTRARRVSAVATTVSGQVASVRIEAGQTVKAGATLVRLDDEQAKLSVRQAKAALQLARAQAAGAARERARLEKAGPGSAVPKADVDRAFTAHEMAQAQVAQAEAALAMARKGLSDTSIRAPFSGLVLARRADEGEWVNTMSNAIVAEIADVDPLEIALEAPEHLLGKISVGDEMRIRFTATDQTVEARVARLVSAVDPMKRSFEVIAEIDNGDGKLVPGLFAEARLDKERAQ